MEDKILRKISNKPMSIEDLTKLLDQFSATDFKETVKCVNKLIDEGKLFEINGIIYSSDNYATGIVYKQKRNYFIINDKAYLILNSDDFFLNEGDEIIYKIQHEDALCIKVTKRSLVYVLGTYVLRRNGLYFFSDEYKYADFSVLNYKEFKNNIRNNYRVICHVADFERKTLKIDKVLGHMNDEKTLIDTILLLNNAPHDFPKAVKEELKQIDSSICLDKRKDLRDFDFITIDGKDAKDFDDAICVYKNEDGYRLLVSIADVSHYVMTNSELDKEALNRGTSIYYPGHVIPMLPPILCDDLCSLKEGVERYTLTCDMNIDYEGNVTSYDIYPSVIKSKHRTTYGEMNLVLEHDKDMLNKYKDITQMIYDAYQLSRIVDKLRKSKGGIEFESTEPIIIEENGKVTDICLRQEGKAEVLIEDFMILANETVASHMFFLNYPLIYRNHDYPKPDKLAKFINVMEDLGYTFKGNKEEIRSVTLQKCLNTYKGKPEESLVSDMLLRSMAKALYSENCNGHYGLGLEHYCHFTSPIRRYPDLMVHRMLKKYVFNNPPLDKIDEDNLTNKDISTKCNDTEKRAVQIERNILDLKRCEFMQDKIGEIFDGIIDSVLDFGFYVELDNTVEGLVHISTLDGFYDYNEQDDTISNGDITYHVGQKVKVRLTNVDLNRRNIDFEVITKRKSKENKYGM